MRKAIPAVESQEVSERLQGVKLTGEVTVGAGEGAKALQISG